MTDNTEYTPPDVWKWKMESGGRFASINRPVAGATFEKDLPVGEHALQLRRDLLAAAASRDRERATGVPAPADLEHRRVEQRLDQQVA